MQRKPLLQPRNLTYNVSKPVVRQKLKISRQWFSAQSTDGC